MPGTAEREAVSTSSGSPPASPATVSPPRLPLGKIRVPGIIYGTAWKKADTARLVSLAIQTGFRGIDTACQPKHYDEAGVGAGIAASLREGLTRADLYLQTKFTSLSGQDPDRIPYDRLASLPLQVAQSVAVSLKNLHRLSRLRLAAFSDAHHDTNPIRVARPGGLH